MTQAELHLQLLTEVFSPVIKAHLIVEPVFVTHCVMQKLITLDDADKLNKKSQNDSNTESVQYLLSRLNVDSEHNDSDDHRSDSKIYYKFLDCLRKSGDEGNQNLADHIEGLRELPALSDHRQQFCRILTELQPNLVEDIKPSNFLPHLGTLLSPADAAQIIAQEQQRGSPYAAFNLLLLLQRSGSDWHRPFIDACREIGYDDAADVLELTLEKCTSSTTQLHQKDGLQVDECEKSLQVSDDQQMSLRDFDHVEQNALNMDVFHPTEKEQDEFKDETPNWNLNIHAEEDKLKSTYNNPFTSNRYQRKLFGNTFDDDSHSELYQSLRPYQRELAQPAIRGLNTVLVAPTGTGKTHVAGYIIDKHFEKRGRNAKVMFIVHTKILADQQANKLQELLNHRPEIKILSVTGESLNLPLPEIANEADLLVLTAQVLVNGLIEGNEVMDIKDLTLIIFDECHNCQKGHPFKKIMDLYHTEKKSLARRGATNANVPQIVGMTASIGTGKAKTIEKARDHAFEILANLDAEKLKIVEANIEDLEKHQNIPEECEPHIVPPRAVDPFRDVLEKLMTKLEGALRRQLAPHVIDGCVGEVELICTGARDSQIYENWVIKLQRECVKVSLTPDVQQIVRACLDHLLDYNRALCLNRDVRTKDALNFLEKKFQTKSWRRGDFNESLVALFTGSLPDLRQLSENSSKNPVLQKLEELIVMEFKVKHSSRALLFTQTIQSTIALREWIDETPELINLNLNAGRLTGAADQTSAERKHTIDRFRSGEHKLLVVTNVVEQGYDVPECNLVFRLNYVPSDTGHIQVKGRNRAKGGKSYLVASAGYGNFKTREMGNKIRETMMSRVTRELSEMSDEDFLLKMNAQKKAMFKTIYKEEMKRRRLLEAGRHDHSSTEYHLHCVDCKTFACSSKDIFLVKGTYRVVDSDDFRLDKVEVYNMEVPVAIKPNEMAVGKIACKKCRKPWGGRIILDEESLLVITIPGFEVRNMATGSVSTYQKWKKVPFMPPNYEDHHDNEYDDDF